MDCRSRVGVLALAAFIFASLGCGAVGYDKLQANLRETVAWRTFALALMEELPILSLHEHGGHSQLVFDGERSSLVIGGAEGPNGSMTLFMFDVVARRRVASVSWEDLVKDPKGAARKVVLSLRLHLRLPTLTRAFEDFTAGKASMH